MSNQKITDKSDMDKERIIEKLDWLFKSALSAPDPTSEEFKEEQFLFFEKLCSIFCKITVLPRGFY